MTIRVIEIFTETFQKVQTELTHPPKGKSKVEQEWNLGSDYGRWDEEKTHSRTQNSSFDSSFALERGKEKCLVISVTAEYK